MVPKADSGAFLLLFLLVLTVTEPLRPGARGEGRGAGVRGGAGCRGRGGQFAGLGSPGTSLLGGRGRRAACWLPRPQPGTVAFPDRAVNLPGLERLVHRGTLFSRDVAFGCTSVEHCKL